MAIANEDVQTYESQGYLLCSGLIPPPLVEAAEAAMWRCIGATREDLSSWSRVPTAHITCDEPDLVALYTPAVLEMACRLSGDSSFTGEAPARAYAINLFPQAGEWQWPRPHLDHSIKEHGHHTFPRPFRIAAMTFLTDVPEHGGGTIVWPGSHQQIDALAQSDPAHYEMMWVLGQEFKKVGLQEPVELTPRRGDVLFYHYFCAHSGSQNTSDSPRLALNMKW